jgi:hypothetical protein
MDTYAPHTHAAAKSRLIQLTQNDNFFCLKLIVVAPYYYLFGVQAEFHANDAGYALRAMRTRVPPLLKQIPARSLRHTFCDLLALLLT